MGDQLKRSVTSPNPIFLEHGEQYINGLAYLCIMTSSSETPDPLVNMIAETKKLKAEMKSAWEMAFGTNTFNVILIQKIAHIAQQWALSEIQSKNKWGLRIPY